MVIVMADNDANDAAMPPHQMCVLYSLLSVYESVIYKQYNILHTALMYNAYSMPQILGLKYNFPIISFL